MRALGILFALLVVSRTIAAVDSIIAAADGQHLWFVQPAPAPARGFELCHHSTTLDGPYFRVQTILAQRPQVMTARDDRLWLVFTPKIDSADARREVFTIQVQFNPAFGMYYPVPQDRLEPAASLPGEGRLASFISTSDGPAALLLPSPRSASAPPIEPVKPRVLRLINNQWSNVPLPETLDPQRPALLGSAGSNGRTLIILQIASDSRQMDRFDRADTGQWTRSTLPVDLRRLLSLARSDGQLIAAIDDSSDDRIDVGILRASQIVPVAQLSRPSVAFALLGLDGRPSILEAISERKFALRTIDPITGGVASPEVLVDQPASGQRVWQVGLIVMAVAAGVLMLFAIKPLIAPPAPLPRGVMLLPPVRRLTALLIDLIPGAILAVVVLRCWPPDLLRAPVITFDVEHLGPNLLMMVVTAAHSTVSEMTWSTTLGKRMVGGEIISTSLSKPTPGRILARNAVKLVVLLAPPMGLVVLLNPHMQGIEDVAGRTWVVQRDARDLNGRAPSRDADAQ